MQRAFMFMDKQMEEIKTLKEKIAEKEDKIQ